MSTLSDPNTLLIFTTSPTGLGHIRVMDALIDGLPIGTKYEKVGIENMSASKIHSLGSRIPALIKFTEFYQTNPLAETIAVFLYKFFIRFQSRKTKRIFKEIYHHNPDKTVWVIVATHFSLAQSISVVKKDLEETLKIKIILCVTVTDDSPQKIWDVPNADLIFVASPETQSQLSSYSPNKDKFKVIAFPVSPRLAQKLTKDELKLLENQLSPNGKDLLHIDIPISGAAVQLEFFEKMIANSLDRPFEFTIIGQESKYTKDIFAKLANYSKVQLSVGVNGRQTVELYESIFYQKNRPALEITKPSEQCFKALLQPTSRGGVILLLTQPVGRQERDNLNFLTRNNLIPNAVEQKYIEENVSVKNPDILEKASHWRGIRLPSDPLKANQFIYNLKKSGLFLVMLSGVNSSSKPELSSNGVEQVWYQIQAKLNQG